MSRGKESPGRTAYFEALERIFHLESEILTAVLPHAGERGRNDEERTRAFLGKVLPRRFSIGTGFIVCANPALKPSRQMDVVIFDEVLNAPLHRELAAFVFPIEMVYGTVEVKGRLQHKDLIPSLESIAAIREIARHKRYVDYDGKEIHPGQAVAAKVESQSTLPPRAFIWAYEADWASVESFSEALKDALAQVPRAHVHGLIVLSKRWYIKQLPYQTQPELKAYTDNALLRFTTDMTHGLASLGMGAASIDRYLDFSESER